MSTLQADAGPTVYEARIAALEKQVADERAKRARQEATAIVYHLQTKIQGVGTPTDRETTGKWIDAFSRMNEQQRKAKAAEMLSKWRPIDDAHALAYASGLVDPLGFLPVSETAVEETVASEFTEADLDAAQAYMAQHPAEGWPAAREHAMKNRNGRPRKAVTR